MSASNIHFENKNNIVKSIDTQAALYSGLSIPTSFTVVQQNSSGTNVTAAITPLDSGTVKVGFEASGSTTGAVFRFIQTASAGVKTISVRLTRGGTEVARWSMGISLDDVLLFPEIFQYTDTGATVGASNTYQYEFQVAGRDVNTFVEFNYMSIVCTEVK